jgi:hypothetical protein
MKALARKVYQPTLIAIAETQPIPRSFLGRNYDRDWVTIPPETKQKLIQSRIFNFPNGIEKGPVELKSVAAMGADKCCLEGIRRDLIGIDLKGVDLRKIWFDKACLDGANFQDTDLRDADLRGVILKGTNLRKADLRGARLDDTTFRVLFTVWKYNTELEGADLEGAI